MNAKHKTGSWQCWFAAGLFAPLPPTGARTLDSKTAFYYGYTLDSPGMIMRLPRVGSQYLMGFLDAATRPRLISMEPRPAR